ncbi:MAG: hypothetical protein ABFS21_12635, partial [Actinomycetota bacterium]
MTDQPNAAILSERYGAPVWLLERSATARAKASGSTVDEVLESWTREEDLVSSPSGGGGSDEGADGGGQAVPDEPTPVEIGLSGAAL